jgi:hypothetical protein
MVLQPINSYASPKLELSAVGAPALTELPKVTESLVETSLMSGLGSDSTGLLLVFEGLWPQVGLGGFSTGLHFLWLGGGVWAWRRGCRGWDGRAEVAGLALRLGLWP